MISDAEIFSNPLFFGIVIFLIISSFLYRRKKWKQPRETQEKIVGFGLGFIPVKEGFYRFLSKKYVIKFGFLALVFFIPSSGIIFYFIKGEASPRDLFIALAFASLFFAVLLEGWVFKETKNKGLDTTGLATMSSFINFLIRKEPLSRSTILNIDLVATIIAVITLTTIFITNLLQ